MSPVCNSYVLVVIKDYESAFDAVTGFSVEPVARNITSSLMSLAF